MQYICYIWKYNHDNSVLLSRDNESFEDFKKRVKKNISLFRRLSLAFLRV